MGVVKKHQIPSNYRVFFAKTPEIGRFYRPHELTEFRIGLGGSNSPNSEFGDLRFGGDKVGSKWIPP